MVAPSQKPKNSDLPTLLGFLYGLFMIVVLSLCLLVWNISGTGLVLVLLLLIVVLVLLIVWVTVKQQRRQLHGNDQLSRLVHSVKRMEAGKVFSEAKVNRIRETLLTLAKGNPDLQGDAYRYLGDLEFSLKNTEDSMKHYVKALDYLKQGSEDYYYVFNRYAAGLLRVGAYVEAYREFEYVANINPYYSVGLAAMTEFGWGMDPDLNEASRLYKPAMLAGNEQAVMNLYEVQWRMTHPVAIFGKDGYAEYMLKCNSQEGYQAGVPSLTESAEEGYAPSQFELGTLCMQGSLGANKHAEAFRWLRLSADQNYLPALHNLGFLIQRRCMDPVEGDINKPKIPGTLFYDDKVRWSSYQSGMALLKKAAEAGYPPSQHSIGATYLREGDRASAKIWLKRAADQGYKKAQDDYLNAFGSI